MIRPDRPRPVLADPGPRPEPDAPRRAGSHDQAGTARTLAAWMEPMLSLDDVAELLSVSRRWLERERAAGRVPKPDFMAGKCPRWKPATIRRWIGEGAADGR